MIRLGTRASILARWQAEWVASRLRECGLEVELTPITTRGDQQRGALRDIGGEGVFTKEIQRALLECRIDLAVHSLKDLPTAATPGLTLAAVPKRGPVNDVLVLATGGGRRGTGELGIRDSGFGNRDSGLELPTANCPLSTGRRPLFPALPSLAPRPSPLSMLPHGAKVGTGSSRRRAQLWHVCRDLRMKDIRGNVETRLRKLHEGDFDALILAEAGLRRLGFDEHITQVLPLELILPAPGQGALGVEARADDKTTQELVAALDHWPTRAAVTAERAMLAALQGGCLTPIAALGQVEQDRLTLTARVLDPEGADMLEANRTAIPSDAGRLGRAVAELLLAQGAGELMARKK
jgi:hydroxymethylbilane synthase